jgi:hypothetical protein
LEAIHAAAREQEVGAVPDELARERCADAGGRPRDEDDGAGEADG